MPIVVSRNSVDDNDVYAIKDLQRELETLKRAGCHPNVVTLQGYCSHNSKISFSVFKIDNDHFQFLRF